MSSTWATHTPIGAATYDEPNPLIVAEESALVQILTGFPPGFAVDVAAGTGRLAGGLGGLGHTVVAVDDSDAMQRRAAAKNVDAWLVRGEVLHPPLQDGAADLVTCGLALTHLPQLAPALMEFARVLRYGGAVVVSDIHPVAVATGGHAFFRRDDGSRAVARNEVHWPSEYVAAATTAGLVVERCEEAFVDESLLEQFGISDMFLAPDTAVLDLPFALLWVFRRD